MKFVSLRTERTHRRGQLDKPIRVVLECFPNPIAASHQIHTYTEFRQQIYHDPRLWRRDVIAHRLPSFFTHVKQLAAIIVVLGILFWPWFGVLAYHAPGPTYRYFDTQKPVSPWSEPTSLKGNHDRGGEHR
jgi:hypothetical protein